MATDIETTDSWADPSVILFAAVHAGLTVTKIKTYARQVQIETNKGNVKIRKGTFEGWTVNDLIAYLKRKLA